MAEQLVQAPMQADIGRLQARWLGTLTPSTRRGYSTDARSWIVHCARVGLDPRDATGRDLTAWLDELAHLRPSTRARRLSAVMSMYTWLRDESVVAVVPEVPRASRPRSRGQDDARLVGLDQATAHRLLAVADDHSPRMSELAALGLTTGLRIQEMLSLDPSAVRTDGGGRVLATVAGKRERTRTVVVPPLAAERLAVLRPAESVAPFFRTRTGRPWSQREARDALAR
ncbi:tyrosine-type recombinase/integrase, partial [Brachybacterium sp. DNPG3]